MLLRGHLNAGTGEPWAGQESVCGWNSMTIKLDRTEEPENFGDDPPTGSSRLDGKKIYLT